MKIPVVFATDEQYFFYTLVAITSMAENAAKDTFYQIYLLVSGSLEKGHDLLTDIQKRYAHLNIRLLAVDHSRFQNLHINNRHVTKATFYRLLLGEMLKEDKCIYLDSDVIVRCDLKELYSYDLQSDYLAGVRDLWIDLLEESVREERRVKTNLPSMDQYINAGVLLLNLKQIRKDRMPEMFCAHMKINYPFEDQDILNVCCYNRIKRLPAKWNLFTLFMGRREELKTRGVDQNTLTSMEERQGIIHYATPFIRPWESERFLCGDVWWRYAALWADTPEYQKLRKDMEQREIGYSRDSMAVYCRQYDRIFIWGFTTFGRELFSMLFSAGVRNIVGFFDSDVGKQKSVYYGRRVMPFEVSRLVESRSAVLIASQRRGKEIWRMLIQKGVREEDIVQYIHKDEIYYQSLKPDFCEGEG